MDTINPISISFFPDDSMMSFFPSEAEIRALNYERFYYSGVNIQKIALVLWKLIYVNGIYAGIAAKWILLVDLHL
jgi:hypothetical protein